MKQRKISKAMQKRMDIITIRYWLTIGLLTPAMIMAEANAGYCSANLIATVGSQPAMAAVEWNVYQGETLITTTRQHSSVQTLPCGDYYITATLGKLTRNRTATLICGTSNMIVIEMGD